MKLSKQSAKLLAVMAVVVGTALASPATFVQYPQQQQQQNPNFSRGLGGVGGVPMPTNVMGNNVSQGPNGMGEQDAYVQTTGSRGCDLGRNERTNIRNTNGMPTPAERNGH